MRRLLILTAIISSLLSCKKEKDENEVIVPVSGLKINLQFAAGNSSLVSNSIIYNNAAGNQYGVNRLQFYLSGFRFESADGVIYDYDDVFYVDAFSSSSINFPSLPFGHYKKVTFYIGLDSSNNNTGHLPSSLENVNMAWPDAMGGGYHFLKLEGNFLDGSSTSGYAMHIGMNRNLVTDAIATHFETSAADNTIILRMNINEWFTDPYIYNFETDGNYSMSDSAAMSKLCANGYNVFSILP